MPNEVIKPTFNGKSFEWRDLEVRRSTQCAQLGVFARRELKVGAIIPIWGFPRHSWEETHHHASHGWERTVHGRKKEKLDGHPSIYPHKGIGCFGLAIAMLINEPSRGYSNVIFRANTVVVQRLIKAGQELLIWYGNDPEEPYERNYTLSLFADVVGPTLWFYHPFSAAKEYNEIRAILSELIEEKEDEKRMEEEMEDERYTPKEDEATEDDIQTYLYEKKQKKK